MQWALRRGAGEIRMAYGLSEPLLDQRMGALEAARTWSPRVLSKLESHVRSSDDAGLFRINPVCFADEKNIAEAEAIDLFLHGTAHGLFETDWLLLCPLCSCVVETFRSLRSVCNRYHCAMCHGDYEAVLDEYVAVTFTVSPAVRGIIFHKPDELSVADYCFGYKLTTVGLLPDGSPMSTLQRSATRLLSFLPPGRTTRLEVELDEGLMIGFNVDTDAGIVFKVTGPRATSTQIVDIAYLDNACEPRAGILAPGPVAFEVSNRTERRGFLGLACVPGDFKLTTLSFAPFLSGKRLLTTQTFAELFRSEVVGSAQGIGVREITVLFTDLKGSTALYDQIGDLNAFALVQQHFGSLRRATVSNGGAIIKTIGDAVMAAFPTPMGAVKAALAMLQEITAFNQNRSGTALVLKVGIHKGAAIVVTLNDRLDYFGQTVNIAARVQALADAGEICLTDEVRATRGVAPLLSAYAVERNIARLKGVGDEVPVYRVTPGTMQA
jgi:class 3 adenylate cyclase